LKLVLFDCDGTLVDSQHMITEAMERAFQGRGLSSPARIEILSVVGLSLTTAVARLLSQANAADRQLVDALAEDYKAAFGDLRKDASKAEPMYPGMRDLVLDLARRDDTVLGIATGKSRRGVAQILAREQLGEAFRTIQTADTHPSKPHPSMIVEAMTELGVEVENTILIGDTTYDVDMAVAAGVSAIGVTWGYHPVADLEAAGAHHIVSTASELKQALDRFLSDDAEAA
jgi:phosphoglycolate phosphatase